MENTITNKTGRTAQGEMDKLNQKFRKTGISMGIISGITYGVYTTLVLIACNYLPLASEEAVNRVSLVFMGIPLALGVTYVSCGLNDFFAGVWLTIYNAKNGKLKEINRSLHTFPGKMVVLGALLGGPIANGAYLLGLAMAGAYAIPISATCALFGAIFAWLFLKQRPTKRVVFGMIICVAGAIIINWVKPEGSENFTLGIIFAFIAAICWGLEGVISSYGGSILDADIAVNIRELVSGIFILAIIVPLIKEVPLLADTLKAFPPTMFLILAGLSAAASFLTWYKANSTVGCAIGMSLNVTYAFWGVLLCIIFLAQPVTATIIIGSIVIIIGAVTVTMNPFDLIKKGE